MKQLLMSTTFLNKDNLSIYLGRNIEYCMEYGESVKTF